MSPENSEHESVESTAPARASESRSFRRRYPLAFGLVVGGGIAILGAILLLIAIVIVRRPAQLTNAEYRAAAARWEAHGPANYNLDLELTGRRPGTIHVEVRDGEATRMTRDGVQPKQERTWYYWSVPGQFDTIEQELEMAKDPAVSYGAAGAAQVALWAQFDPRYGYPTQFDRIVLGADLEIHWKVTRFEALPGKDGPASGGGADR